MSEDQKSLKQIIDFRIQKLNKLKDHGVNPYPAKFKLTNNSLHIKNAPQAMKDNIKHFDYWMAQPTSLEKQDEFRKWIGVLDKHRGVSIKDYLPEVAGYYGIS